MEPQHVTIPPWISQRLDSRGITAAQAAAAVVPDPRVESAADVAERQARQNANRTRRWYERLPSGYATASLGDLPPEHQRPIKAWIDNPDALHLILAGNVGTGKTHAAYAVGNAMVTAGVWCEAWHVHDLLKAMRPDGDPYAFDRAQSVGVLVLDELSTGKTSDWAAEEIGALIDSRLARRRRTVITTNEGEEALRAAWGDRTMDRLRDRAVYVVMRGESRRRPAW